MTRQELEAKVLELVAMTYQTAVEQLSMETAFQADLKGASLQLVGLVAELENELDVLLQLQEAAKCPTIGELVDLVEGEL